MILIFGLLLQGCAGTARDLPPPDIRSVPLFSGEGAALDWAAVIAAMDKADVIVIGESHKDPYAHTLQVELIKVAVSRWDDLTLSLEEFDRRQQSALDAYGRGELDATGLQAERKFVDPVIRNNWRTWYYPKLAAARDGGADLLASNAPTQYSRLVRNVGCDNLPDLADDELTLFDCPAAELDSEYQQRFTAQLMRISTRSQRSGLKPLEPAQTERMFRAQRVWDGTMAASIVAARAENEGRVLHLVGNFHSDFDGGLIDEIRYRDPNTRILVISMRPRIGNTLRADDRGRADIVVYTRGFDRSAL